MKKVIDLHTHLSNLDAWIQNICKGFGQNYQLEKHFVNDTKVILSVCVYAMPYQNYEFITNQLKEFTEAVKKYENIKLIKNKKDLEEDFQVGILFHLESARLLDNPKIQVPELFDLGIRGIIPIHFIDNIHGNSVDSPLRKLGLKKKDNGISNLCKELINVCNDKQIWLDLSHSTDKCGDQILERANQVMVSHVGIRDIISRQRNKTIDCFKAVHEKGGIFGISPWAILIGGKTNSFKKQFEFAIEKGLGKAVCIGSDFGAPVNTNKSTRSLFDMQAIVEGLDSHQTDILWDNAYGFLERALPSN